MKSLRSILQGINPIFVDGNIDIFITGIVYDSRKVKPGNLFVCVEGYSTDGHKYIKQSLANGAAAIIIQKEITYPNGAVVVRVANSRLALAQAAAAFYDYPGESLNLIGITGTNGKTTTTYLISHVLRYIGKKTGVIGTIHNLIGDKILETSHTTPESSDLQALLLEMKNAGISDVVMEVSSHALSLERVAELRFQGAIFTNLTQDHLDFHKTMDEYFLAKSKLFTSYHHANRVNLINIDDVYGEKLAKVAYGTTVTYSIDNKKADFKAENIKLLANGISYSVKFLSGEIKLNLKLLGEFNVYNSLAVVAYAISSGIAPDVVREALEQANGVSGRFELIDCGQPFTVAVDYAHTPDGLENVITSARKFARGSLITVFGCGGDRDRTKRPIMGDIAARLSDQVIITSDNPRSEEPEMIINDILAGVKSELRGKITTVMERRKAITIAITMAKPGDILIVAGKGHEDYQIIKDKVIHFDDREEARQALKELGYED